MHLFKLNEFNMNSRFPTKIWDEMFYLVHLKDLQKLLDAVDRWTCPFIQRHGWSTSTGQSLMMVGGGRRFSPPGRASSVYLFPFNPCLPTLIGPNKTGFSSGRLPAARFEWTALLRGVHNLTLEKVLFQPEHFFLPCQYDAISYYYYYY